MESDVERAELDDWERIRLRSLRRDRAVELAVQTGLDRGAAETVVDRMIAEGAAADLERRPPERAAR